MALELDDPQQKAPKLSTQLRQITQDSLMSRDVTFKDYLEDLKEFSLYINSLREIVKAKSEQARVVWLCLGIACLVVCLIGVFGLIGTLIENPTATRLSYRMNQSLTFPIVSICTFARVNASKTHALGMSNDLLAYMMASFKGMYLFYNNGGLNLPPILTDAQVSVNLKDNLEELEEEYQNFTNSKRFANFSLVQFFLDVGVSCDDVLSGCMFQGADFSCCEHVTEELSETGKCFVLRSPNDGQTIPGSIGGLKIYISNWASSYPSTHINSNPDDGLQIHVIPHNQGVAVTSKPMIVLPNSHAMIRLQKVHRIVLNTFDENGKPSCTRGLKLEYYSTYTTEACFTECMARLMVRECGCVQIGSIPLDQLTNHSLVCSPYQSVSCVQRLLQDSKVEFLWNKYDIHSECECPIPCTDWDFETVSSYSSVPNQGYQQGWVSKRDSILKIKNLPHELEKKNFVILDVYYESLIWKEVREIEIFGFSTFLSSLGGQLSVWLGIRLLTVVQVVYYLLIFLILFLPILIRKFLRRHGFWKPRASSADLGKPMSLYPPGSDREPRILSGLTSVMFLGVVTSNSRQQQTTVQFADMPTRKDAWRHPRVRQSSSTGDEKNGAGPIEIVL